MKKLSSFSCGLCAGFFGCFLLLAFTQETAKTPSYPAQDSLQAPEGHFLLQRGEFCLDYDGRLKQPLWVLEEVSEQTCSKKVERNQVRFQEDKDLPKVVRSSLRDYKHSGFDRGHIAAAANHTSSKTALAETFLISNCSPQCPHFNRTAWAKLERLAREIVKQEGASTIITGPLFLPSCQENGEKLVSYQVIGENNIAVPSHYFKIIQTSQNTYAYIMPNENDNDTPLSSLETSVRDIEKAAGIRFNLPDPRP